MTDSSALWEEEPRFRTMVCAVGAGAAVVAALQRIGTPYAVWTIPLGLACSVPWVLAALARPLPKWVGRAFLVGATGLLVWYPVPLDAAPFQLVTLAAVEAAMYPPRESATVWALCLAMVAALELAGRFDGAAMWMLGITLGALGGYALRAQDLARTTREGRVVLEERQRIARELHDVAGHSLAVMLLQLTGARLALHRDPVDAEVALQAAEDAGRRTMADIRRVVGLLGASQDRAPAPVASDLPELVQSSRAAGVRVDLAVDGDLSRIDAASGLTLYRIAQESIANAVKHAPNQAVAVRVAVDGTRARMIVTNPVLETPELHAGGFGLRGMVERAELVGGECTVEQCADRWTVTAEVPLGTGQ